MQRNLVLLAAVVASIATSRLDPADEPAARELARVMLVNDTTEALSIDVALAEGPSCGELEQAPWLAGLLSVGEPTTLELPALGRVALPEPGTEGCTVARVTVGEATAVVFVSGDREWLDLPAGTTPEWMPRVVVRPEGPAVFQDGGEGLLVEEELPACEAEDQPVWTELEAEGTLDGFELDGDCAWLEVGGKELEVCGVAGLEALGFEEGAPVRVFADDRVLDVDVFGGPRLVLGEGLARLLVETVVTDGGEACGETLACGGTTAGVLEVDGTDRLAGDVFELDGGELAVLAVHHPLQSGCAPSASVRYLRAAVR